MELSFLNLVSALAVGLVIFCMALVPSIRLKALLYVLPIPISIGLIATHGKVTVSNLIGLMLVWVFFWLTRLFADILRLNIVVSDIFASVIYIGLGYILITWIHLPYVVVASIFCAVWATCLCWFRAHPLPEAKTKAWVLAPAAKGSIATMVSFIIYSLKHHLAGVVVTFPYNGIFAVIETRHYLQHFSRLVVRNTLAIAALFTTMYCLQTQLSLAMNLMVGWCAFGVVLWLVQRIRV